MVKLTKEISELSRNLGRACSPGRALKRERQNMGLIAVSCACSQRIRAVPVSTMRSAVRPQPCYFWRAIAMWRESPADVRNRAPWRSLKVKEELIRIGNQLDALLVRRRLTCHLRD
eukprot:IDg14364t1